MRIPPHLGLILSVCNYPFQSFQAHYNLDIEENLAVYCSIARLKDHSPALVRVYERKFVYKKRGLVA